MIPPIYSGWQLWVGVALMLLALRLSYTQLRSYSADEWNSLTDDEQVRLLWLRGTWGGLMIATLWVASMAILVQCDPHVTSPKKAASSHSPFLPPQLLSPRLHSPLLSDTPHERL